MKNSIVCFCKQVTEATIMQAIGEGSHTLDAIRQATGACTGTRCVELNPKKRCCSSDILALLSREIGSRSSKDECSCDRK